MNETIPNLLDQLTEQEFNFANLLRLNQEGLKNLLRTVDSYCAYRHQSIVEIKENLSYWEFEFYVEAIKEELKKKQEMIDQKNEERKGVKTYRNK